MADCLTKNRKLEIARELYDFLFDAHKVFEILNMEEAEVRKKD